ncbi:MAG: TonB-dependent receptor [Candidatus Omnitrophica bacterium]|nr:TonB-dependent receptor [Candidatus Omnitrophota bacterium]
MPRIVLLAIIILALLPGAVFCEESHQLGKIVVTPSRIISSSGTGRSVTTLDSENMSNSAYDALQDIIGNLGGIDIRRRGPEGVQSDINIRGATFEQNTVMIDGIKINDPQTGHYTMDLPLTSFDREYVEILRGPASSLYGADSFGGVINVITKKPEDKKLIISATGGTRDYFSGGISLSHPLAALKNRFSIEWNRARPYIPDSEFDMINLSESSAVNTDFGDYDFFFGYSNKNYGANTFYSNLYPREAESTDTRFFKLTGKMGSGRLRFEPKLFLRRHYDKFSLDKTRPGWQTNYSTNYTYGADLGFVIENPFLDAAYGFELSEDRIFSTNMQKHDRGKTGLYAEITPHIFDPLYINAGIRQDTSSDFETEYSPSVNMKYALFDFLSARAFAGRSFRVPTFTDLYYRDAANIGNEDLKSESSWTYEVELDYISEFVNCSAGYFRRNSRDTIDWTRMNTGNPWRVSNIGTVETNGAEASVEITPRKVERSFPIERFFLNYTALDSYRKHDYLSKYALDYLKQQISAGIDYSFYGFNNSWVLNYKKRVGDTSSSVVIDTKLTKGIINIDRLTFEAFLEITNLFDEYYSEQSGVPMPGRWIKSGVRIEF